MVLAGELVFQQLFERESSTYTYLLGDGATGDAVLIDPVLETVDRDLKLIEEHGLKLKLVLDTHLHADHITGSGLIRKRLQGAVKTGMSVRTGVGCVDIQIEEGWEYQFGRYTLKAIPTPGHTNCCTSFLLDTGRGLMVFTGDSLMIRAAGRVDFQQGSADVLYDSITQRLFTLPDSTRVFPSHDYRGISCTTIGTEKKLNPRIGGGRSKEEFKRIMNELRLSYPKRIAEALPANMKCGLVDDGHYFHPQSVNGMLEITAEDLHAGISDEKWAAANVKIIDVRRPEEFTGELGHIRGARLVTLGPGIEKYLREGSRDQEIVFVCRSGGRSGSATSLATDLGYTRAINMQGGMLRWNELGLPVDRK